MDAASFERVRFTTVTFRKTFQFHVSNSSLRLPSAASNGGNIAGLLHYLRALLVQAGDGRFGGATPRISRNRWAENLSESVGTSARAMQRFLTEARWSDDSVIGRLQEYLAPRLGHPDAVWVFDGSDFPKQGRKSAGVARQYCGRLGKVANCQAGMFLAYVSPLGRALVDKRLYLPESWTSDPERCAAAGVPEERRSYRSNAGAGPESGSSQGRVGCRRRRLRELALEMRYVLDVPGSTPVWPLEPAWTSPEYQGSGRPRKPRLQEGQRRSMEQRRDELPDEAWREITVAQGSQGPRSYQFSAQRVRATRKGKPGEELWAVCRRNLDAEPGRQ